MFKIVAIISDTQVVVNAGLHDVKEGDVLKIIGEKGPEILDPDTGKSLGTLDVVKAKIIVDIIYDQMCICKSMRSYGFSEVSSIYDTERLCINPLDLTNTYMSADRIIRVGDLVVK